MSIMNHISPENKIYYDNLDYRCKLAKEILKSYNFKSKKEFINSLNKLSESNNFQNDEPHLITSDDLRNNNFINKSNLIYTLKLYKLYQNNHNNNLRSNLQRFYNLIDKCKLNLKYVIYLQNFIRKKIKKYSDKHGPAYYNINLSNNITEFYSFDDIKNIDKKFFLSLKDQDNFIYSFDIRSLKELFSKNIFINPYNRFRFSQDIINSVNNWSIDKNDHNNITNQKYNYPSEYEISINKLNSKKLIIKRRVTDLFQIMDNLDQYTNVKWFNDLNINQLKEYYRSLEDIWNYRANLNSQKKWEIIQDSELFHISIHQIYKLKNITQIQIIILDEIEKLITKGINRESKILGCLYVLASFAEISHDAHNDLAWLINI